MFGMEFRTKRPAHRTCEVSSATDGGIAAMTHGLMAGTRVASNLGWRAIEALAIGDMVLTFDNGMQRVANIRRVQMWLDAPETAENLWPVVVPEGALDNRAELTLLPDQAVMIESDAAQDTYGDPFAVLAAQTLVGLRGIHRRRPMTRIELIAIYFAADEVIYAEGGALIHCPQDLSTLDKFIEAGGSARYQVLCREAADALVSFIGVEDHAASRAPQAPVHKHQH